MKQIKFSLILFLLLQTAIGFAQLQLETFEQISTKNGLSQSVVTSICQDKKGFLWVGTQRGLNRYDGYKFVQYFDTDSLKSNISGNYIRCILCDNKGNLWVGTNNNGLNLYRTKQNKFVSFQYNQNDTNSIPSNTILSIIETSDNRLWIGTANGLTIMNKKTRVFKSPPKILKEILEGKGEIKSLFEDHQQNIWIGTEKGVIRYLKKEQKVELFDTNTSKKLSGAEINCIFQYNSGDIYLGTNNGLSIYNFENKTITHEFFSDNSNLEVLRNEIYSIANDANGNIWVGTFGGGLIRKNLKSNKIHYFVNEPANRKSLSSNHILTMFLDQSGLLWIGTYGDEDQGGLNKLQLGQSNFTLIEKNESPNNSLISNDIYSILEDKQGFLWLGTEDGVSIFNQNSQNFIQIYPHKNIPKSSDYRTVYAQLQHSNGKFWIGTAGKGLICFDPQNFSSDSTIFKQPTSINDFKISKIIDNENPSNSLTANHILCLYETADSNIWVGTNNGLNIIDANGNILNTFVNDEYNPTSLSNNEVLCIFQDKSGVVWIGTYDGLNRYYPTNNLFRVFYSETNNNNTLPSNTIYSIYEDHKNRLWLATDDGLCYYNAEQNSFKTFRLSDGLPDNVIYGILSDEEKNLWISTNNGLCKIIENQSSGEFTFISYNNKNGLSCNAFNIGAYHKNNDGMMFFGCNAGLTVFLPQNIKGNTFKPPVVITDFQLFFKTVEISDDGSTPLSKVITETTSIELDYKQNRLYFEFAALSFFESYKNEYAYKMEGLDDDWIFCKDERRAYYNLNPGKYIFRVKAANNSGFWNDEGTAIEITVRPPFYRENWFYTICILAGVFLLVAFVKFRVKRYKAIQKILERKVAERTEEVMKQKEELEATLENLRTMQSQLVNAEKMASLGQLTAGVAHEINNPINFINGNITPLKRDVYDIIEILEKYDEQIEKLNIKDQFAAVEELKEELEYKYLLDEINDLMKGMEEGVRRTTEIVKGLRNFSRLDENDMKATNLNEGLASTLLILKNKLKNRIEIEKHFGELPLVHCYPGKINQVFMNILNNASDAIEGNGKITITTKVIKQADNQLIEIRIKDSGIGMSEEVKNKIFEPFFTTKEVGKGTGLGLSISYGIISDHKGKINVESEIGKGTEFIITLPISAAH